MPYFIIIAQNVLKSLPESCLQNMRNEIVHSVLTFSLTVIILLLSTSLFIPQAVGSSIFSSKKNHPARIQVSLQFSSLVKHYSTRIQ